MIPVLVGQRVIRVNRRARHRKRRGRPVKVMIASTWNSVGECTARRSERQQQCNRRKTHHLTFHIARPPLPFDSNPDTHSHATAPYVNNRYIGRQSTQL